jgi:serine/threonine-protein kinase
VDSVAAITGAGASAPQPYRPSSDAFDLYLQATRAMNADVREAERLLHASIAADARYARPHVALANAYIVQDIFGVRSTTELAALARAELERALAMDPESAEAHAAMGALLARHYFQWDEGERQMRRALELDPHSSFAHNQLAQNILAPQERWEEAEAETHRALELDPLSTAIPTGRAFLAHLRRDFKTAIQEFREAVARNPQPLEYSGLFGSLAANGQLEEASTLEPRLMAGMGPMLLAVRASALARAGRMADAREAVRQIETYSAKHFVSASIRGIGAATIGRLDEAFRLMDQARAEHSSNLIFLRLLIEYDPLRADPRFAALLADVGLSDQDLEKRRVNRK